MVGRLMDETEVRSNLLVELRSVSKFYGSGEGRYWSPGREPAHPGGRVRRLLGPSGSGNRRSSACLTDSSRRGGDVLTGASLEGGQRPRAMVSIPSHSSPALVLATWSSAQGARVPGGGGGGGGGWR